MSLGFIFPGQGAQFVGMGKDVFEKSPVAKRLFEQANDLLGYNLAELCFEGPEEELKKTYITQPAIFVHSVIVAELLKEMGFSPSGPVRA